MLSKEERQYLIDRIIFATGWSNFNFDNKTDEQIIAWYRERVDHGESFER